MINLAYWLKNTIFFMNQYGRFIGAAFQMLVTILFGVWLGTYLDSYFANLSPLFTISFSLLSIALALFALIKSLPKEK
jgi:F0F1-type ATP synthase assembly protein I